MPIATRIFAVASAAALIAPAAAQAQQPTLEFDRSCYTERQDMHFMGAGYTPGGRVDLLLAVLNDPRAAYSGAADAGGALDGVIDVDSVGELLRHDEERTSIIALANDVTRFKADTQPPETQFGFTHFTFTNWEGYAPGRYVAGRRAAVEIYGWAFAAGDMAWVLFRKGSRTVASVRLGRLDQECGDRKARIRVPRGLRPGAYRVVLTTDRQLQGRYTWRRARVTARRSAAAAVPDRAAMVRVSG